MIQVSKAESADSRLRRPLPRWAWTTAGAAVGLFDFGILVALDANMMVLGRDITLLMTFFFVITFGFIGWAIAGLALARQRADDDRATIEQQLAELARTQRALVQEEKLAGIGRLAAGVAHEVRNPLGVIRASASMARESFESNTDPHRALGFICEETDRLDRLIGSLLTFAKPQPVECVATDVTKIIDRAIELAQAQATEHGIALEADIAPGLPTLMADPDRLSQALYGLTLNAIQAIASDPARERKSGHVLIRAHCRDDVMRLEVVDSGPGISAALRDQIFEPFVTTKDTGTGLGLPMALRMVEAQGGALSLVEHESTIRNGACFRIEFHHDEGAIR